MQSSNFNRRRTWIPRLLPRESTRQIREFTLKSLSALNFFGCHWLRQCVASVVEVVPRFNEDKLVLLTSQCHTWVSSDADVKTLAKPVAPEDEVQGLLRQQAELQSYRADLPASTYRSAGQYKGFASLWHHLKPATKIPPAR